MIKLKELKQLLKEMPEMQCDFTLQNIFVLLTGQ